MFSYQWTHEIILSILIKKVNSGLLPAYNDDHKMRVPVYVQWRATLRPHVKRLSLHKNETKKET